MRVRILKDKGVANWACGDVVNIDPEQGAKLCRTGYAEAITETPKKAKD